MASPYTIQGQVLWQRRKPPQSTNNGQQWVLFQFLILFPSTICTCITGNWVQFQQQSKVVLVHIVTKCLNQEIMFRGKKKKKTQVLSLLEGTKNFIPSTIEFFSTWKYKPILQEHIAESKNSTYYNLNSILSVCKGSWIYGLIIMVQELLLSTSGFSLHAHTAYNNSSHKNHLSHHMQLKKNIFHMFPSLKWYNSISYTLHCKRLNTKCPRINFSHPVHNAYEFWPQAI